MAKLIDITAESLTKPRLVHNPVYKAAGVDVRRRRTCAAANLLLTLVAAVRMQGANPPVMTTRSWMVALPRCPGGRCTD
jgi:hypothetical protein